MSSQQVLMEQPTQKQHFGIYADTIDYLPRIKSLNELQTKTTQKAQIKQFTLKEIQTVYNVSNNSNVIFFALDLKEFAIQIKITSSKNDEEDQSIATV